VLKKQLIDIEILIIWLFEYLSSNSFYKSFFIFVIWIANNLLSIIIILKVIGLINYLVNLCMSFR
jgi:hypothetical protein